MRRAGEPVPSSVIRSFNYTPERRELFVVFQTGRRYTYLDVPEAIYRGMKASFSKGEYFNAHIRDRYRFVHED